MNLCGQLAWNSIRRRNHQILLFVAVFASCSNRKDEEATVRVNVVDGIAVVEVGSKAIAAAPSWQVDTVPWLDITSAGAELNGLHRVAGVQIKGAGVVVVAEQATARINFHGVDGSYLFSKGRKGSGPGEFIEPTLLTVDDSTSIAVFDGGNFRTTVMDKAGVLLSIAPLGKAAVPIHRFADGSLLSRGWPRRPRPTVSGTVVLEAQLLRVSGDGTGRVITDYGTFPGERFVLRLGPRGPTGGNPPFQQVFLVAARDSVVVSSSGERYELEVFDVRGQKRMLLRVDRPPRVVARRHIENFRDSVLRNYAKDEYTIREWTMLSNDDVFPERFPEIAALYVDQEGALWVRDFAVPEDDVARWVVFSAKGTPIGRVVLPLSFAPTDIRAARMVGVLRDDDGLEHVVGFTFRRHRAADETATDQQAPSPPVVRR